MEPTLTGAAQDGELRPMETAAASPEENKLNVSGMSTTELQAHVERCRRLVGRPQLLERLPDGGASIRARLEAFTRELDCRREAEPVQSAPAPAQSLDATGVPAEVDREAHDSAEETYASNVAAIMEKYKNHRVSVEKTVRNMYGGSLSEQEITRIVEDVPEGFFLTYSETVEREREMAKKARQEELARLRQQSSAHR